MFNVETTYKINIIICNKIPVLKEMGLNDYDCNLIKNN